MSPSRILSVVLWVLTTGILVQAGLAGQFTSGSADLRWLHEGLGLFLTLLAVLAAIVALVAKRFDRARRSVAVGTIILPFALSLQLGLGWAPAATATAIHVPLGVTLFGLALILAVASGRPHPKETTA